MIKITFTLLILALVPTWCYGQKLSGTVFEDANYGGGAGRSLAASGAGASARSGATVELYDAAGAFVATAMTDAAGAYGFNPAPGTYTVRVVSSTVSSARPGYVAGLLPVPTYNGSPDRVGGEAPQKADAPANTGAQTLASLTTATTTAQALATVTAGAAGPDFGFNFDLIVNTNDAGPGSLRQFMLNANALGNAGLDQAAASSGGPDPAAGTETSIFMISDGRAHDGLRAGLANQLSAQGVALISPASQLPFFTDARTALDGTTQTQNVGNTNNVTLGTGGTVGTAATALSQVNGPEVQLQGSTAIETGLNVTTSASSTRVRGLALLGFGTAYDASGIIRVNAPDFGLTNCVVGTTATSFTAPATIGLSDGMRIENGGNDAVISNTLFGFNGSKGITINALNGPTTGLLVTNCEFRANAQGNAAWEGIDLQSTRSTVRGNLFVDNIGNGVDSFDSGGGNVVSGNTIVGNGRGTLAGGPGETPGVRVYGANNTISGNIISDNYGAGILLQETATTTVISQNSIFNNGNVPARNGAAPSGQVGIDLNGIGQSGNAGTAPFVTLNDVGDTDAGGNGLLNFPVLETAAVSGGNLVLRGFATPGALVEVFLAAPNTVAAPNATGNNFGQGKTFLFTRTEGSAADADNTTGSYGPGPVNGFAQGQDNTNRFAFSVPLSSLTPAQQAALGATPTGARLTATATVGVATSEFSGIVPLAVPLTGIVFEDANYGGGAGRSRATLGAGAVGRAGVRVELYDATGGFLAFATTNATGLYVLAAPPSPSYVVRVVSSTVSSARPGYVAGLLPVPTYNGSPDRVGGEYPARADAGPNTTSANLSALLTPTTAAQCVAVVVPDPNGSDPPPVDFGFNFSTIVNTSPAGQGSLAQFIRNSNALTNAGLDQDPATAGGVDPTAGTETSIFMITDGQTHPGLRAFNATTNPGLGSQLTAQGGQQVAVISLVTAANALPAITDANTDLDATTQTRNIGNTNNVTLGAGGTVGVGADGVAGTGDELALTQLNGPEVQLNGTPAIAIGLDLQGPAAGVSGFAVVGFGSSGNTDGIAGIQVLAADARLTKNVIGTLATSFTAPTPLGNSDGMRVYGKNTLVTNNLIGFNSGKGITVLAIATNSQFRGNELRSNGQANAIWDGIDVLSSQATAVGNLLINNTGQGLDSFLAAGSNTVSDNTCVGNGGGSSTSFAETAGIRMYGNNNVISRNLVHDNYGAGLSVVSSADINLISQNSFYNNGNVPANNGSPASGQLGIDLLGPSDNSLTGTTPFVTLNDGALTPNAGNQLLDYPILLTASRAANVLTVTGNARPGATIEFFLAQANLPGSNPVGANFGQGKTYLSTAVEGSAADADASTGVSYSGAINGFNQGSDTNANGFRFAITLTPAQLALFAGCETLLTSTATLNGATSEFSGNLRFNQPVALRIRVRGELPFCTGGNVRLSAGPWPVGTTFTWLNGATIVNGAGSVANDSVFVASTAGSYTVRVTLPSGCPGVSNPVAVSIKSCTPAVAPEPCSLNEKFINTWYFGDKGGLDFNAATGSIPPVVLTNGQMNAPEGTSTTSDANGQLLFYSNGYQVWNRNHVLMPNGAAVGPPSNTTITDGPIAVRLPGSTTRYVLFTQESEGEGGVSYSEIDMTLDGGLGDVVAATRNTPLVRRTTEKMTSVLHANGCDTWVIVHGWGDPALGDEPGWPAAEHRGDEFLAFRVTPAGVQLTPVVSKIGPLHAPSVASLAFNGQMKVSPDGRQLALVRFNNSSIPANGTVELYDFSATTGAVSNPRTLDSGGGAYYGVEFSPDQRKVYATILSPAQLLQFDLDAPNIPASKQVIATSPANLGSIQAGPDGKLYVCRQGQPELGVITRPDSLGTAAKYVDKGQALGGRLSGLGLPNFTQSFLVKVGFGYRSTACQVIEFQAGTNIPDPETYAWDFGEPSSGANNTSTIEKPSHSYAAPGIYTITLRITKSCLCKEIKSQIIVPGSPLPGSIAGPQTLCAGAQPAPLTSTTLATQATGQYTYQWQQSTDNGVTWTDISGATSATYAPAGLSVTTQFRRRAASGFCAPSFTAAVLLTVLPPLTAGAISADQQVCVGNAPAPLNSTAPATGGNGTFAYQWEQSTDNGTTWTAIGGATGATYAPGPVSATTQFRRVATSGASSCAPAVSGVITVTITPVVAVGSIGADQSVCAGATPAPLTGTPATGGTGTYAYQWEQSTDNGASWTAIGGATGATYAPGVLNVTTQFRRQASSGGCPGAPTSAVTITVTPALSAGSIGTDQSVCAGTTPAPLTSTAPATGGTGSYAYQWQISTDNGASWTDIGGATDATYAPGPLSATTQFRRVATSGSCARVSSAPVALTVSPILTPTVSLSPPPVQCPGTSLTLTATPGNAGPTPVYRWLVNGTAVAVTGPTFSSSTLASGDQVRVELSPTPGLCSTGGVATATVTISQSPAPTPTVSIDAQPAGPVCPGDPLTFSIVRVTNAGPGSQYQWQVDGSDVAGATGPTFRSTTLRDGQTVSLRLRATTACGPVVTVASNGLAVRLNPPLKVNAGPDKEIRQGQSVTLEGTADGSYPVSWTPATGLSFPSGDRLRPVATPPVTTTYTLSAGTGGCATTDQVTVTVRAGIRIPNAFTPNGDGLDDTWQIEFIEEFPGATVKVFNRWGNQIFSSENYSRANEWKGDINGEPAPVGTYYYIVVTKGPFGQSYSGPLTVLY